MLRNLLMTVAGAILVLLIVGGGPAVWFYDRAPVGWPNLVIGKKVIFGCCVITLHAPGAGALTAARAAAANAKANDALWASDFATMQRAFIVENASITRLGTSSAAWQAWSRAAVAAAARANAWRLTLAQKIANQAPPADTSELGYCRAADQVLKEGGS